MERGYNNNNYNSNQGDEESEVIKDVISHKKSEHRVEIRRKKITQELQSKRLKNINSPFNGPNRQFQQTNPELYQSSMQGLQQQNIYQQNSHSQPINASRNNNNNNFNNQVLEINGNEQLVENTNSQIEQQQNQINIPDLLSFRERVEELSTELQNAYKFKDILQCSDIISTLQQWIYYYTTNKELFESQQILRLCIFVNIHSFCTTFTCMKYLGQELLQFNSYYILAQLSFIIEKPSLNEMARKNLFNHFIECIQHVQSPHTLDNMYHTMANLAGDPAYGTFFCIEMMSRDVVTGSIELLDKFREDQLKVFVESYLFFLQNLFKNVPEYLRNEINVFLNPMILIISCFPTNNVKILCAQNLQYLLTYNPQLFEKITEEEDFSTLVTLIEKGEFQTAGIEFMQQLIFESNQQFIQRLVQNNLIKELTKVLEGGNQFQRRRSALILSNIASFPDQTIQDIFLEERTFQKIMKSLIDDCMKVRQELAFFFLNLVKSGTSSTKQVLLMKKCVFDFLKLIFEKFSENLEIVKFALESFYVFFDSISICTPSKEFQIAIKKIEEIGLFYHIDFLRDHPNKEISSYAEEIYHCLRIGELTNTRKADRNEDFESNENQKEQPDSPIYELPKHQMMISE